MDTPLLLPFASGNAAMADLLGGKGANLAEMTNLGLPVPPGFTITTEACRRYLRTETVPEELPDLVAAAVRQLESEFGRGFGSESDPLLVSVRSGARYSMPGMMDTVLNVGLTDRTLPGLAERGGWRFAWDCYRRLVQMYGHTVLGIDGAEFDHLLEAARTRWAAADDAALPAEALEPLVAQFRAVLVRESGQDVPQDPSVQLSEAIHAVFRSWNGDRARTYRAHEGIAEDLGTAVNVVAMVYGNTGNHSGSGVCFTRDPATGAKGSYGDYLPDAQGEDVVNGSRVTMPLAELAVREPALHGELLKHLSTLEEHYRDLCDVEFTVEDGRLWLLQTRVGKRSPAAAFRIAADMAAEGIISLDDALLRVDGHQLEALLHPQFDATVGAEALATGLPASPGAGVGTVVFTPERAVAVRATGGAPVLVRTETSPDDLAGMIAAEAVVTARGGLTSHAAVVARGLGRTCVTSASGLVVDSEHARATTTDGVVLREGDVVSVDGTNGVVYRGALRVRSSPVAQALDGEAVEDDPLVHAVTTLLSHADRRRHLGVRANAETGPDAARARRLGADGIGLCRTEHMLLGERRALVERVVVDDRRREALAEIEEVARQDFLAILRAMDGMPVVVRLLDPPLHEFLPDLTELTAQVAREEERGTLDSALQARLVTAQRWHEQNPMLGLRGVRLLTVVPDLVVAHVRALDVAARQLSQEGLDPRPEIMVPLVADEAELELAVDQIRTVLDAGDGSALPIPVGTMIELPRAALTADALARHAEFFSFGTNDLTQTTWGISRDDAEASFLQAYRTKGLLRSDPFTTLDQTGVGQLVSMAARLGRSARPGLGLGVCGEHAGDPESIRFFADIGLDYVSCSPPRVPVARLEAGRSAVRQEQVDRTAPDTR
jgi:pyruvate,orthophosphate dikinase